MPNSNAPLPRNIRPMLSTLVKEPFNDAKYLYEIKFDGYRIIAYVDRLNIKLESRGGMDYTKKYPPITSALKKLNRQVVLDGEVVYLNENGIPDFDMLQTFNGQKAGPLAYYVFDILWLDGKNLMSLALVERKALLKDVLGSNPVLRYSEHFDDGLLLFKNARENALEGIMAKRKNSRYIPGNRSNLWLKFTIDKKEEFVVGGWIESESRKFRTLLFGAYEGKKLKWIGHAGGGYKEKDMPKILDRLKALETNESPFTNDVDYEGKVHWVKPELVANIKYATVTRAGKIRKPAIFLGFREDKKATQVVRQMERRLTPPKDLTKGSKNSDSNWNHVDSEVITSRDVLQVDGKDVHVYNVNRTIWRGISKAHLLQYYHEVSDFILPHLRSRPLSLYLKLENAFKSGVYIKDMEGRQPSYADVFTTERKHKKSGKRNTIDYLVCNNKATLLYLINLGCVDINPWTSTTNDPDHPSYITIDLDPSDGDFKKAVEAALAARQFFLEHKIKSYPKTSGKTGMHLYLPCDGFTFEEARLIAEHIAVEIHSLSPGNTTLEVDVASRGNHVFIDPSQNDYTDTLAAPYSVRPFHIPLVSTPLEWKEITFALDRSVFTMEVVLTRLNRKGDLFAGVLDNGMRTKNGKQLKRWL
jgi:bifunctional non-homologous end joining protein LigD